MSLLDEHLSPLLSMELIRTLALKMQEAEIPNDKICQVLSVSKAFLSKWKRKYKEEGISCLPSQYKGRPSYLSPEQRAEIIEHLSLQLHYSLADLVKYIEDKYNVFFKSKQSYYDLLSAGGLSWHKTQKSNPKRDEQALLAKRAAIKKNWIRKGKRLKKGI